MNSTWGIEHIVDATGCDEGALTSRARLERLLARIVGEAGLRALADPIWHVFPPPGGITGLVLLAESHLTVHTYPETRFAALNLYCCRPMPEVPWRDRLIEELGARDVRVRSMVRSPAGARPPAATSAAEDALQRPTGTPQ